MMVRKWLMTAMLMSVAIPASSACAAVAQSNEVTITGGYHKLVPTSAWEQTGTTQQAYPYSQTVTTYVNESVQTGTKTVQVQVGTQSVQTGTTTQTEQTGTKQVQVGTQSVCYGGWVNTLGPTSQWRCVGPIVQVPVYQTEPIYATLTVPVYTTEPVYRTETYPVYTTESVPVSQMETLTGYKTVPVYGWVTVNTDTWVPVVILGSTP